MNFDDILKQSVEQVNKNSATRFFDFGDLTIIGKNRQVIPFTYENMNPIQQNYYNKAVVPYGGVRNWRGCRAIVVKPRQVGSSTFWSSQKLLTGVNIANTLTLILAHLEDTSVEIKDRISSQLKRFAFTEQYSTLKDNSREILLPNNSKFHIGTDKSFEKGRGFTYHNLLATEAAFYVNAPKLLTGVVQSIPEDGNIIWESTGNGTLGMFYELTMQAAEGSSEYMVLFDPWHMIAEYAEAVTDDFEFLHDGVVGNEKDLAQELLLTQGQILFRRKKIRTFEVSDLGNGLALFKQEYPSNLNEAFRNKGNLYFNVQSIDNLSKHEKNLEQLKHKSQTLPKFMHHCNLRNENEIFVLARPQAGRIYKLACDPSEGVDADSTVIGVFDSETWEIVALVRSALLDSASTGNIITELGAYYNSAELIIERNNHGHAVIQQVIANNYPLHLIWKHEEPEDRNKRKKEKLRDRFGFQTNMKTKPLVMSTLKDSLNEGLFKIPFTFIVKELKDYSNLPNGKLGAPKGRHDDCVIMLALANWLLINSKIKTLTVVKENEKKRANVVIHRRVK
jgi:hypothetical protein